MKDIVTGATVAPALTTAGSYNNKIALGGIGASGRITVLDKRLTLGLEGHTDRVLAVMDASSLSDVTSANSGEFSPSAQHLRSEHA